jgi:hypothetical protein
VWNGKQVRIFEMIVNNAAKNLDDKIVREERGKLNERNRGAFLVLVWF